MGDNSFYHEAGKGSRIRSSEDRQKYSQGYDAIFGKKCRKVCKLDSQGVCTGCDRTIDEIKEAGKKTS